jgi:hypothetical protein
MALKKLYIPKKAQNNLYETRKQGQNVQNERTKTKCTKRGNKLKIIYKTTTRKEEGRQIKSMNHPNNDEYVNQNKEWKKDKNQSGIKQAHQSIKELKILGKACYIIVYTGCLCAQCSSF